MGKKRARPHTRVIIGENAYDMEVEQIPNNSLNIEKPLVCPYCKVKLRILSELIQFGEFEDKSTLRLACVGHKIVFLYNHIFSRIEVSDDASN